MRDDWVEVNYVLEGGLAELVHRSRSAGAPVCGADGGALRIARRVEPTASVKDAVERLGIPHTEVLALALDGAFVGFGAGVHEGAELRVLSHGQVGEVPPEARLGPSEDGWTPRFVVDVHLGTLVRRLRLLGFDCAYDPKVHDPELARLAASEDRALLTRDRGLLKRSEVRRGYLVRSSAPPVQLDEVLARFRLVEALDPFARCILCNGAVEKVDKAAVEARLEPGVLRDFDEFWRCTGCGQPYWKGSHYDGLVRFLSRLSGRPA